MHNIDHKKLYKRFINKNYPRIDSFEKQWQNDWWNLYWFLIEYYPDLQFHVSEIYDIWYELGMLEHKRI
jgi:hypothetical protein